jgi:hypothetical protein
VIVTQQPDAVLDSTADDRARLVVLMAIRAFGDGVCGADWLVQPNDELGGALHKKGRLHIKVRRLHIDPNIGCRLYRAG